MEHASEEISWDPQWEEVFRSREWGKYPPEELVRFVARNFFGAANRAKVKLLEIGCGTGANIWFLARESFTAFGIDGSPTAIFKAEERLNAERLVAQLKVGDIAALEREFPSPAQFDAVIDVCCLQCNRVAHIRRIITQVFRLLKPGGKIFSMLLAKDTLGQTSGQEIETGTRVAIKSGSYAGIGLNHFFTLNEVEDLFSPFPDLQIEFAVRSSNGRKYINKHWVVQGTKPL